MTLQEPLTAPAADPSSGGVIKLAVMAVGGQGGGVLTGWIEDMARAAGLAVQATSVAGVAQRTGATVYYVEMAPRGAGDPVFALMPAAGDVDILIAAEMMEAGRAIIRGFVTPDRTTLIASTHRALAVSEKTVPGDGIAESGEVEAAAEVAARRFIRADFDALAVREGSVISATLFGALAASGALPFPRDAFEAAVRAGAKGVEKSLAAFEAGFAAALADTPVVRPSATPQGQAVAGPRWLLEGWRALDVRRRDLPEPARDVALRGLQKVVDFQDLAYGSDYLDLLERVARADRDPFDLTREAARHLANAMAYDDIIRVADEKTRAGRRDRIATEMGAEGGRLMRVTEFLHPRAEEIVSILPAGMGARWAANPARMRLLDRLFNRGRRLRSDRLSGFVSLYLLAAMRGWRRRTLRHAQEMAHIEAWLSRALALADANYPLAVEAVRARRLIKGYSDTHARGLSKFDRVIEGVALVEGRTDAADWARRLIDAALKDEEGKALDGALATIRSFA